MLKGSDHLTKAEEEVLKMLLERGKMASRLTKNVIYMRKWFFILRNMITTSY